MIADLDDLLTALYVLADEILPRRPRARRRPPITDAELVCLAVAQVLLDCPSERTCPESRRGIGRRREVAGGLGTSGPIPEQRPRQSPATRPAAGDDRTLFGVASAGRLSTANQ